jgi:hypothetical protein
MSHLHHLKMEFVFIILGLVIEMACSTTTPDFFTGGVPRVMSRCECSGTSFSDVARTMVQHQCSHEHAMAVTDVGQLCTACIPDLELYLASLNLL